MEGFTMEEFELFMNFKPPRSKGTIMGVTYDGGVILGADSQTNTGMHVAENKPSSGHNKITNLADNIYLCCSGSPAESKTLSDYVRHLLHHHTIQSGLQPTVKIAANLVGSYSYSNKNKKMNLIVGGWDKDEGGKIYSVSEGGKILELPYAVRGSGCLDQPWKWGMTKEEALKLVVLSVSHGIVRDGASGSIVRTVIVNSEGVSRNFYPGMVDELEPYTSLLDSSPPIF